MKVLLSKGSRDVGTTSIQVVLFREDSKTRNNGFGVFLRWAFVFYSLPGGGAAVHPTGCDFVGRAGLVSRRQRHLTVISRTFWWITLLHYRATDTQTPPLPCNSAIFINSSSHLLLFLLLLLLLLLFSGLLGGQQLLLAIA